MRLLHVDKLDFTEFPDDSTRPKYAIASHRWVSGFEATYQDVKEKRNTDGLGYKKVEAFAHYVRDKVSSIEWLWIDTCCINKESDAELSEAINSMFRWYRNADLCIAYLASVESIEDWHCFEQDEWFRRGWTLQELLAPRIVVFVTKEWKVLGNKGSPFHSCALTSIGPDLGSDIAKITGIPERILSDYGASVTLGTDERMKWMDGRRTAREEDMWYALFGIVGVTPGANYGEGYDGARQRLLAALRQRDDVTAQQAEEYQNIVRWLAPPDPWTNHESAVQRREPDTGAWLLQSAEYQAWKAGSIACLWVHGKAGCGKTILCAAAIEDMRAYCRLMPDVGHVIFYFTFSDENKQSYEDLLLSLVVQLGWKPPGLPVLRQAYSSPEQHRPRREELQKVLLSSIESYDQIFLHLDALDECQEGDEIRQDVLAGVRELVKRAPSLRVLVTSRDIPDVRHCMSELHAKSISIAAQTVNSDIRKYVAAQLSRNWKLAQLDSATKKLIEETLTQRADGMFRWVFCQLQELKKFKSTKPRALKAALLALPATLDETYERMLVNIDQADRADALLLLRWLAYAQRPLSLAELAEATIVDPTDDPASDGIVDVENRGGWGDALEILAGLILVEGADEEDFSGGPPSLDAVDEVTSQGIEEDTRVRLAHFSIKEYLESTRICASNVKEFHMDPVRGHRLLSQSCVVYLVFFRTWVEDASPDKADPSFPLLQYAAINWPRHASLESRGDHLSREVRFLLSEYGIDQIP